MTSARTTRWASYGALTREERNHQRIVRVTVRIGDYGSDSSSSRGDGSVQLAPEDNDPEALKYALWTTTDEAYKAALRAFATKQAELKRFEKQPTEKDFSKAEPIVAIEPMVKLELDATEWKTQDRGCEWCVFDGCFVEKRGGGLAVLQRQRAWLCG